MAILQASLNSLMYFSFNVPSTSEKWATQTSLANKPTHRLDQDRQELINDMKVVSDKILKLENAVMSGLETLTELQELNEKFFTEASDHISAEVEEERKSRMFAAAERVVGEMDGKLMTVEDDAGIRLG